MIETIARCAIAAGADGIFIETHPDPANAKSDGANMLRLDLLEGLMERLTALREGRCQSCNQTDKQQIKSGP